MPAHRSAAGMAGGRAYPPGFTRPPEPDPARRVPLWIQQSLGFLALLLLAAGATLYLRPLWVSDLRLRWHLHQQHVRSEYVEAGGYRLHYFEALPPAGTTGTPLVLVHGLGSRGEDWSALMPTLAAQGFHVYAPDLLGYGRSAHPDVDYTIGLEEQTVVDFMHAVGLEHADLGGWSMGGWVVLKLALDYPEKVERLVVYDSAGIYFPAQFDASLFTPTDAEGLWRLQQKLTPAPARLPAFVAHDAIRKLQANAWVIGRSVRAMIGGRELLDFRLGGIHAPTLIVWGGADALIPLQVGETMHTRIPGSSLLVVDGCGHLAPAECAKPVLKGTVNFLLAQPPPPGATFHGNQALPFYASAGLK